MKPNILFLVIDSFRSDKCYDKNKTSITPNIDLLISKGIYFTQTISSVASTVPSIGSMFTGMFPFKIGMSNDNYEKLDSSIPTYVDHLKQNGYSTFAATSGVASFLGLTEDFDLKLESSTHNNYYSLFSGLGDKILKKLDSFENEPWFFYIHVNDLHQPIIVPKNFNDKKFGENDYEKMVSAIDVWIGKLLKKIDLNNTLIILTADHGEYIRSLKTDNKIINFESDIGEKFLWKIGNKIPKPLYGTKKKISLILHKIKDSKRKKKLKNLKLSKYEERVLTTSRMSPGSHVYDDVLKVPLIFSGYNINSPKIISQQIGVVDIFPTIVELVGLKNLDSKLDGTSLVSFLQNIPIDERPIFIQSMPHISKNHDQTIGIRTNKFKYFRNKNDVTDFELYDLINDPLEENNISENNSEIIDKMENLLQQYLDQKITSNKTILDNEERKKIENELKKMGYI